MRLRIRVNNVASSKEDISTYMIKGKQPLWIRDSSDFLVTNFEIEEYDPKEHYVGRESAIFLLSSVIERNYCNFEGKLGNIWRVIYYGKTIDKLAWAHLFLDEAKTISSTTRLGENDRERCLKNMKPNSVL
ncbi:hypothetical protein RF11_14966 [Thelohanellus kitauei]|uniref:Uncharacterized protein n=1 Tax=Thelohanellus kitauei TaxID=669202 RepID=A0A0C2MU02_THEKT|nr:hypothetical protein RF11_14966 [Thelohanellus kitauei]